MPVRIRFSFYGEEQIDRTLVRFIEAAEDATPVWNVLADRFLVLEGRQFASEGGYASGGWAPLSAAYAAWKAKNYPGKTILRRTDDLWRSLTQGPAIRIIEPRFMVVGSDVDYGEYHQTGTGRMPRRRPIEFTDAERREWVRLIHRWIVTGELGAASAGSLRSVSNT